MEAPKEFFLVPTDFSENAENAIDHAVPLADKMGAGVLLCNAFSIPYTSSSILVSMTEIMREDSEKALQKLKDKVLERHSDRSVHIRIQAISGELTDAIHSIIQTEKISLVVMGTKGSSQWGAALFGSTTSKVINKIPLPILAIPEQSRFVEPKKVVFATDFDLEHSRSSLHFLTRFVGAFNSELEMVTVQKNSEEEGTTPIFIENLEAIKQDLKLEHLEHSFDYIQSDDVEDGIIQHFQERGGDMLVMIAKDYPFLERIFHKSLTKRVALHTRTPLLVLHEE